MDVSELIERYEQRREERESGLMEFLNGGERNFLVIQRPSAELWGACNTIAQITRNNLDYLDRQLKLDWTDELPYLEPWIGTGAYASAFGCEYKWREDNAPDVYYRFHTIDQVRGLEYPDYRRSSVLQMVLECIDILKERTFGKIPICLTDTQSPFDTASLILDAAEFMTACLTEEETADLLLRHVTDLIIEFSRVQQARIGDGLVAKPGHIMPATAGGHGISLSDDNLSFCSSRFNQQFALPYDREIALALGGVALHSCGAWTSTMSTLRALDGIFIVDCAVSPDCDPNPNHPARVREALKGSGILLKARVGGDIDKALEIVEELFDPSIRICVEINYTAEAAEANYHKMKARLEELYEVGKDRKS
jgi:hypothetical protein